MFDLNHAQAEQLLKLLQYTLELASQQHPPEASLDKPPDPTDPWLAIWPHLRQAHEHLKSLSPQKTARTQSA